MGIADHSSPTSRSDGQLYSGRIHAHLLSGLVCEATLVLHGPGLYLRPANVLAKGEKRALHARIRNRFVAD